MLEKINRWISNKISSESDSDEKKDIIYFGITRIVEDTSKIIIIALICIFLGIIKEFILVFLIMCIYKTNIGGVHSKTNLGCFLNSLLFFLICIYGSRYIMLEPIFKIGIYSALYIFGLYVIWVYVPADVPEIPIISKKIRKKSKIVSLIILNLLYILVILFMKIPEYQNMVIYTIFYINIMTTRIMYKLFKNKYGYENYVPDELVIID